MISKQAVGQFLERERKDYRPLKELPLPGLRALRDALPTRPPIWKKLSRHQRACFLLGAERRRFGFFLDTGMGKSLLSIALVRYFQKLDQVHHVLILVPNKINKAEWTRELRKWGAGKTSCILRGSSAIKLKKLESTKALFIVETYAGLSRMASVLVPAKKRGRKKLMPSPKLVKRLAAKIDGLILDESTHIANRSALATRICNQLKKNSKVVYALTGTPFGRDPTALWSQLNLIDDGYTLGETLGLFRAAFFTESKGFWGGYEYKFQKKKEPLLNRFLAHSTIRYEVEQSDLPTLIPIVKEVSLPHDAEVYVERAREALKAAKGNYQETQNAFLRMRQISSGWIGYGDEEGTRAELVFPENPKMDLLASIIQSIPQEHKVIIFHDYIFSGGLIEAQLTRAGASWGRISGLTKDHDRILRDFDSPTGVQCLILNNRFGMGPNLQAAKYGIYYEAPCSVILRKQTRRRFERQGSTHKKVFQFDLVVRGTFDQRILDFHEQGKDLFEAIIEGRERV